MTNELNNHSDHHNLKPPRQANLVTLSDEQLEHLLSELGTHPQLAPVRDVARLIVSTGLRLREAAAVRWSDVDFDRQIIRVMRKNIDTPYRAVPLRLDTLNMLRTKRNDASPEAFVFGQNPLQFFHRAGRILAKLSIKLKLPPVSFYMLRRTFIVRLVNSGYSPQVMATILGWRSPENMMSLYGELTHQAVTTTKQHCTPAPATTEVPKKEKE